MVLKKCIQKMPGVRSIAIHQLELLYSLPKKNMEAIEYMMKIGKTERMKKWGMGPGAPFL